MTALDDLLGAARAWRDIDPDPVTRGETDALIDAVSHGSAEAELRARFATRLTFGTAGLRGALGAGPNRMNRVIVMQTSAGLARFLHDRHPQPTAVVGYDARHNSRRFARDAAGVLAAAGVGTTLLSAALPTPVLAFAVRLLGATAGVMITASHNPAADNGYKLYLGGQDAGSQLVDPADREVLAAIDAVVAEGGLPASDGATTTADDDVLARYVAAAAAVAGRPDGAAVRWVYTPMHGVGHATMQRVVEAAGLPAPLVVEQQRDPDPDFPTVAFPNPEEPGALDLANDLAIRTGADLVIANDPDADRLAVAIPERGTAEAPTFRRLSGNEVGLLLAWTIAAETHDAGGTLATSIVSTPALARIATRFGFGFAATLTGFKWISRAPGLLFGFEEALGYLVDPENVRDKDGISAAMLVLRTARTLAAEGRTIADRLAEIEASIGCFASDQVSIRVDDLDSIRRTMAVLRADRPAQIGGVAVLAVDDLLHDDTGLPHTDGLRYTLAGDARVVVRPSGTEPKLKVYIDVLGRPDAGGTDRDDVAERTARLRSGVRPMLGLPTDPASG